MRKALIVGLIVSIHGCGLTMATTDARDSDEACLVLRVAERYLGERYHGYDSLASKPVVTKKANTWEVTYPAPRGSIVGGELTLEIDAATRRVVRTHSTQ